ncbi:hypothetical protein N9142_03120 [Akkermansiaceae bacterium]|nr:hypothetical protein [Akkermansiaceae bacterium]
MKQLIIILISIGCALFSLAQDQPKVVGQLVSKRDEAFKKANEAFMVKVVKLQGKYTKNGDIESAKKLAALINDSADQDYKSHPSAARGFAATRDRDFKRINEIFIRELVKIQSNYTASGDFENAKKVAALISDSVDKAGKQSSQNKVFTLDGKWRYKIERGNFVTREFKGKYLIDEEGGRHHWKRLGETITIEWGSYVEKVQVDPKNPDLLKGVNWQGRKLSYERVKESR